MTVLLQIDLINTNISIPTKDASLYLYPIIANFHYNGVHPRAVKEIDFGLQILSTTKEEKRKINHPYIPHMLSHESYTFHLLTTTQLCPVRLYSQLSPVRLCSKRACRRQLGCSRLALFENARRRSRMHWRRARRLRRVVVIVLLLLGRILSLELLRIVAMLLHRHRRITSRYT